MKILNLVDLDKSDIKYKISRFPDGQQQVTILNEDEFFEPNGTTYKHGQEMLFSGAKIKARLNNWLDLELIVCAVNSLREIGFNHIALYVPYFLGSRSDRKFEEGSNNYLKDVICPIINSLQLDEIEILDPHSDVLEACIKGFKKESNLKLVEFVLWSLYKDKATSPKQTVKEALNCILLSPDAGASKKIYKLVEQIGYKGDIITCSKDRDKDGKLTKTIVPYSRSEDDLKKDYIIIDDICDGGATFINIAKEIKEKRKFSSGVHPSQYGKIYLIVTHGIFSKGFVELDKYFDGIYTTNSYKDFSTYSEVGWDKTKLKQLNVY